MSLFLLSPPLLKIKVSVPAAEAEERPMASSLLSSSVFVFIRQCPHYVVQVSLEFVTPLP